MWGVGGLSGFFNCYKRFHKVLISSFWIILYTYRQTDRQTDRQTVLLLLSCAKSHMLSASRRQPHLLHVSTVDRHQTWSMDKSWRCVTLSGFLHSHIVRCLWNPISRGTDRHRDRETETERQTDRQKHLQWELQRSECIWNLWFRKTDLSTALVYR